MPNIGHRRKLLDLWNNRPQFSPGNPANGLTSGAYLFDTSAPGLNFAQNTAGTTPCVNSTSCEWIREQFGTGNNGTTSTNPSTFSTNQANGYPALIPTSSLAQYSISNVVIPGPFTAYGVISNFTQPNAFNLFGNSALAGTLGVGGLNIWYWYNDASAGIKNIPYAGLTGTVAFCMRRDASNNLYVRATGQNEVFLGQVSGTVTYNTLIHSLAIGGIFTPGGMCFTSLQTIDVFTAPSQDAGMISYLTKFGAVLPPMITNTPWDPRASLSNGVFMLDTSYIPADFTTDTGLTTPVTTSGGVVKGIVEQFAGTNNATQATTGNCFTYNWTEIGRYPALVAQATAPYYNLGSTISLSGQFTHYGVINRATNTNVCITFNGAGGAAPFFLISSDGNVYFNDGTIQGSIPYTGSLGNILFRYRRDASNNVYFAATGMAEALIGNFTHTVNFAQLCSAQIFTPGNMVSLLALCSTDIVTNFPSEDANMKNYASSRFGVLANF